MALFKIQKGLAANLATNRPKANEGWAYFTTDDGKFYIDIAGNGTQNAVIGDNRICLNAAQADKVGSNLIIKLNNGAQEGSSLFTYNGSESKVINITPSAIGALAADATAVSASKVVNALTVQGNGTKAFDFDGSAAKTLNIKPGSNVTVTSDTNGNITIASSYTNSRDPGYGQIKAGTASSVETAITANTSTAIASTYNEILTINPGNKWIAVAASNSSTAGADSFTIGHSLSGVTAGSYGDSAAQTPSYGGTFNVPYITVDAGGHVTGISTHTVKIPTSDNVDTKVTQTNTTANGSYRVLLSISTNDNSSTDQVLKNANLTYNPSTGLLSTKNITLTGDLRVNGDAYLNNETYAEDITTNTLLVNGNASFAQIPTAPTATAGDISTKLATTEFVSNASNLQSGTVDVDRLANSGATAGSYGPNANQTPAYGATFNVPYLTVDAKGRITAISNKTVKIPAADNTDIHVNMIARGTTKAYLLATTTAPTSSNQAVTSVAESGVYLDTTAGRLVATQFSGNLEGVADEAKALTSNAGSTTQPIYFSSGKPVATSYALKATVNNATQWGVAYYSTTTNLTSTAAGAANTALMGKGSAAPAFVSVSPSLTWANGTTGGPSIKTSVLGVESTAVEIPIATSAVSGVVNTAGQTFAGDKTFTGNITSQKTIFFGSGTGGGTGKAVLGYDSTNNSFGMWYFEGTPDVLTLSASGNSSSKTNADFSINGLGDGKLSNRNKMIPTTGNTTGTVGSASQPVWVNAGTITAISDYEGLRLSLGLSKAMRFIGIATVAITDGSTTDPTISNYDFTNGKNYGDVIIDKDSSREYVWSTTNKWELLGGDSSYKVTQSAVDSGAAVTNKWVSRIQQNANGVVTVTMGTLDTSGTWSGTATWATNLAVYSGNECTVGSSSSATNSELWINWRSQAGGSTSDGATQLVKYNFGNRKGSTSGVTLVAAQFSGNAATATKLSTNGTTGQFWRGDNTWSNTLIGGLEIKGHIAGDSGTTGHGLYSGGAYHNAYNNIILHGDASTGSSGIAFISDKVSSNGTVTTINQPSDRAFIQYHACGVSTITAEGTTPTIATSGEVGRFVIGVGNDAGAASPGDQMYFQTRGKVDILHLIADTQTLGVIPDTGNTTGTVGSSTQPVYVNAGTITSTTYSLSATINSGTASRIAYYSGANAISSGSIVTDGSYLRNIGGYNNTSYALSAASAIINSWIRTTGATGWYNESYGGGWYMNDSTWVRVYNNKQLQATSTTDSSYSTSGASILVEGGASVKKRISAKEVRIDNATTGIAALLQYDVTLQCLNFVFA